MFQRPKEKRTKTPFFLANGSEAFVLQQIREKTLGKTLCFLRANALSLHEGVNGSPINAAKFFQRFLCCRRFTLRLYHDAPVRAGKLRCPFFYAESGTICGWHAKPVAPRRHGLAL